MVMLNNQMVYIYIHGVVDVQNNNRGDSGGVNGLALSM